MRWERKIEVKAQRLGEIGNQRERYLAPDALASLVLRTGKAMAFRSVEPLMLKRSLVGSAQRLELTGWTPARLEWYKAEGCFTEIIRYRTRLFVPVSEAAAILARLAPQ